jgi:hypothetical protein
MPVIVILPVAAIIVGLFAILIIFGGEALAQAISSPLRGIPLVGGKIAGWCEAAIVAGSGAVNQMAQGVVGNAAWLVWSVVGVLWTGIAQIIDTLSVAYRTALRAEVGLVGAVTKAENYAYGIVAGLIQALGTAAFASIVRIDGRIESAYDKAVSEGRGAIDYAKGQIASLDRALGRDISGVERYAHGLIVDLQHVVNKDITNTRGFVRTQVKGLHTIVTAEIGHQITDEIDAIDRAAKDAVIGPWHELLPALKTLEGALPAHVVSRLNLPAVLSEPIPLSIPGILSLLAPAIAATMTEVAECGVPICGGLKDFAKDFEALLSDGILALLLAWLVWAADHPVNAADDIVDTVAGPANAVLNDFLGLVHL